MHYPLEHTHSDGCVCDHNLVAKSGVQWWGVTVVGSDHCLRLIGEGKRRRDSKQAEEARQD